jgi:hypothetical protein
VTIRTAAIIGFVVVAGLEGSAGVAAQRPGRGTIAGVVVSTDATPQPIPRAVVMLTGNGIRDNLSVVADEAGRFRFVDVEPGRYNVAVSKPAYLPTSYGAKRPGRPGTSIAIAAGQQIEIQIPLTRGGVITGTVRDQFGQPAAGVQVSVSRADFLSGQTGVLLFNDSLTTDDLGVYRAYGLMPDEYVVSAVYPRTVFGPAEMFALTRAEIDARMRELERPTTPAPGNAAAPRPVSNQPADSAGADNPLAYAPTYYPGTPIASNAIRIRVASGEERNGVDINLVPVRAARVSGVVNGAGVASRRLQLSLTPTAGPSQPLLSLANLNGPMADGSFTFTNTTPGRYTLSARTLPEFQGGPIQFASMEITVDGADIGGLALVLRQAMSVSGRVVFESETQKPPESPETIRVALVPARTVADADAMVFVSPNLGPAPAVTVRHEGTFTIGAVLPGTYTLTAAKPGWTLKSAVINGRNILDIPLEVTDSSEDITDAVLTYSDKRSELSGTLTTASGQPASEFVVIVYPADRGLWRPGARRIRSLRPGSDGAFSTADLPPGEYLIAAITDADPNEWQQASFLAQLVPASVKITIADGQKVRQDLRIAR